MESKDVPGDIVILFCNIDIYILHMYFRCYKIGGEKKAVIFLSISKFQGKNLDNPIFSGDIN